MSTEARSDREVSSLSADQLAWGIVGIGLAALYAPTYWNAWNVIWQTDDMGHGPIILAVLVWLFWGLRTKIYSSEISPVPALGWPLFLLGIVAYVFGRVFNISSVEFASHLFVISGLLLLLRGTSALKVAWFAVIYLIFLVPLPATFVDMVTGPLKHWISVIVVEILYLAGYPIARTGVVITVGQYQLLVADACSGLHSMFSLAALGTLFMYIMRRQSLLHNTLMLLSILPIAFAANIVRVIVLVLITYYLGDEAGQGFLHGTAGMVLLMVALVILFAIDALLAMLIRTGPTSPSGANASAA